jgi:TFIIF-interacting CTD phosphatase-like protein
MMGEDPRDAKFNARLDKILDEERATSNESSKTRHNQQTRYETASRRLENMEQKAVVLRDAQAEGWKTGEATRELKRVEAEIDKLKARVQRHHPLGPGSD